MYIAKAVGYESQVKKMAEQIQDAINEEIARKRRISKQNDRQNKNKAIILRFLYQPKKKSSLRREWGFPIRL